MTGISDIRTGKAVKVAGLTYILVILFGVVKVNFLESSVIMGGDFDPASNISANELMFRMGIVTETFMFILVIILSLALYIILKPVDKNLALSGLIFRFGEAVVGVMVTILSGIIPLLLLDSGPIFQNAQIQALVKLFLNVRIAGLNIVLVFIGLGGSVFCFLFYISRLVPRILAAWGIFTYASMLMLGFLNILLPARPDVIEVVLFSFGALFEVMFGIWLLFKGVNVEKWNRLANKATGLPT